MTKKHFKDMAMSLRLLRDQAKLNDEQYEIVAQEMASFCHRYNFNFDTERFLDACYPEGRD